MLLLRIYSFAKLKYVRIMIARNTVRIGQVRLVPNFVINNIIGVFE